MKRREQPKIWCQKSQELPTSPALGERGSVAALKSLCNDWEKMTTFCSKAWNNISSAASLSLHFSTEPVTGSVGTGWIYSLGSGAATFSYFKLKLLFTLVGLLSADNLILTLDPLSLKQSFFFVLLFKTYFSSMKCISAVSLLLVVTSTWKLLIRRANRTTSWPASHGALLGNKARLPKKTVYGWGQCQQGSLFRNHISSGKTLIYGMICAQIAK